MDVTQAVMARRSIRAFSQEPVPKEKLEEIMGAALRAPSWGNTQPWGFAVVGGTALDRIREECVEMTRQGVPPRPEVAMPSSWNDAETSRYKALGRDLFEVLGIRREDAERRRAYYLDVARLFGAPAAIYLHLAKGFNPYALMDAGIVLQTIALLAVGQGLGTCYLAMSVIYPEVVRRHAEIPPDRVLVMGLGIGHPIPDHPANLFRSPRGKASEFVRWIGFE